MGSRARSAQLSPGRGRGRQRPHRSNAIAGDHRSGLAGRRGGARRLSGPGDGRLRHRRVGRGRAGEASRGGLALSRAASRILSRSPMCSAPGGSSPDDRAWQVDLTALEGERSRPTCDARTSTENAIARPPGADGAALVDPLGGVDDLAARRLRASPPTGLAAGPVARAAAGAVRGRARVRRRARRRSRSRGRGSGARGACRPSGCSPSLRRLADRSRASRDSTDGRDRRHRCGPPRARELRGIDQSRFHHLDGTSTARGTRGG